MAHIGKGRSLETGKTVPNNVEYGPITSATMISSTGGTLSCKLTVQFSSPKLTKSLRGVAEVGLAPNGRLINWRWLPNY